MVAIVVLGLIVSGCIPVVPPAEQDEPGRLPKPTTPAPEIESGIFIDYQLPGPPQADTETDSYQIRAGITWSTEPVKYRDADGVDRWTTWPVEYYINPANSSEISDEDAITAISAGFAAWEDDPDSVMNFVDPEDIKTTDSAGAILDGMNTVSWKALGSDPNDPVAYCAYWYYPGTKTILEFDIVLNDSLPWSIPPLPTHFNVPSVATHEAGHTLILFDLRPWKDGLLTMYAFTWKGDNVKDTLGPGDRLGIRELYP